jgi:hypothetical protein
VTTETQETDKIVDKVAGTPGTEKTEKSTTQSLQELRGKLGNFARIVEASNFPTLLLYGPTGSGKTYTAASFTKVPELCPVALIAIERTDDTLIGKSDIDLEQLVLFDPHEYKAKANLTNTWDACKQVINKVLTLRPFPFKTVILDGISTLQYFAEDRAVEETPFHSGTSVLLELTQQGDYRIVKNRILPLVMDLVELCALHGAALILTAQERPLTMPKEGEVSLSATEGETKVIRFAPALMPSLISPISGAVSVVGKMRISSEKSIVEFRRTQYREAKDRTGLLGASVEQPTAAKLVKLLRDGGWKI